MHERERVELGKIDFLLDELARAVERGDVPLDAYNALASRHLARRAEIVLVLTGRSALEPAGGSAPASAGGSVLESAGEDTPVAGAADKAGVPRAHATARVLNWTTVLLFTGAFLAIVATAAFAFTAWESVGPAVRAGALGLVTLGFYVAGDRVRSRLDLPVAGAALTIVGSAMLLFDGWILIDGFGLPGPWPWAGWFVFCSVIYWLTEVRYGGRAFGAMGGVAQIAWWWLLGSGFAWDASIRLALVALVMVSWLLTSRRLDGASGLAEFSSLLGPLACIGSVVTVLASVVVMSLDADLAALVSAAIVGWSATFVLDGWLGHRRAQRQPTSSGRGSLLDTWAGHPGLTALCHVPFALVLCLIGDVTWWGFALVAMVVCASALYELRRGGLGFGILALLSELALVALLFGLIPALDERLIPGVFALLALSWMIESVLMVREVRTAEEDTRLAWYAAHAGPYAKLATIAGWVVLVLTSLAILGTSAISLGGVWATAGALDIVSAAIVVLCWLAAAAIKRQPGALGAMAMSIVLLALTLDALQVSGPPALRALYYVALAVVWAAAAPVVDRTTTLPRAALLVAARIFLACAVAVAIFADAAVGNFPSWQEALLLGIAAALYAVDAHRSRSPFLLGVGAFFTVMGAGVLGGWHAEAVGGAIAGGAAALVFALGTALARRSPCAGRWPSWIAASTGLAVALTALAEPAALAIALALVAFAFAAACVSSARLELLTIPGVVAIGAVLAVLAHFDRPEWLTVAVMAASAFALLAPALFTRGAVPALDRVGRALGITGVIAAATLVLIALLGGPLGAQMPEWASLGQSALALSVAVFGAALLAYFIAFDGEATLYTGVAALIAASWIGLGATPNPRIEWFSALGSVYLVWCGYRWASRDPGRTVPLATDIAALVVALGVPAVALLDPGASPSAEWAHTWWALGLGVAAILVGRLLRVRAYFFGGIAIMVWLAVVRSWAEWWWLVLFLVGTAMIVFVVAREWRQRMIEDVRDTLGMWR